MSKIIRYKVYKDGELRIDYAASYGYENVVAVAKKTFKAPFEIHPIEEDGKCYNPIIIEQ